jgi:hypothetical protein
MAELDPSGGTIDLDEEISLRTPGLRGSAQVLAAGYPGLRSAAEDADAFVGLLEAEDFQPTHVIEITDAIEGPTLGGFQTLRGEDAMEVDVPAPPPGYEQTLLLTDEAGVMTWHFSQGPLAAAPALRGAARRTYRIPRAVRPAPSPGTTRGLAGALGRKVIRVLAFKVAEIAADKIVSAWESHKRPHRLRTFTAADQASDGTDLAGQALRPLAGKRALLVIHGTGSTTAGGYGNMHSDLMTALQGHYEGRVFAFDHPTIATTPDSNARWLVDHLPGEGWDLDLLTHSRGGLVARTLTERGADVGVTPERLSIKRVVFLGTPSAGTPLADMQHMGSYVDTMTNLLQLLAVGLPIAATLAGILATVKQLAAGAISGLAGLECMLPGHAIGPGRIRPLLRHGQQLRARRTRLDHGQGHHHRRRL